MCIRDSSYCGGQGRVRSSQGFFTIQQTCPQCGGEGEKITNPCNKCSGIGKTQSNESVSVKIPKGVDDGTRIRLAGKGEAGSKGGTNGDLYLFVSVEPHSIFKRSEENLYYELPISIADATLGTAVEVPSIDGGKTKIKIPSGTQSGKQLRLRGKGMPILKRNVSGDLYIRIITEVPTSLTKKQKELLEEFKTLEDTKVAYELVAHALLKLGDLLLLVLAPAVMRPHLGADFPVKSLHLGLGVQLQHAEGEHIVGILFALLCVVVGRQLVGAASKIAADLQ